MKYRSYLWGFSLFLFGLFSLAPEQAKADFEIPSSIPTELPYAIPYDDGTTIWEDWILLKPSGSASWVLLYHNSTIRADEDGYLIPSPEFVPFDDSTAFVSDGDDWVPSSGIGYFADPVFFDTLFGGVSSCSNLLFASNTIFATGQNEGPAYCVDVVPYDFGDPVFARINLLPDNITFKRTTADPAPEQIIETATEDFVPVPSIIDDPSGFVSAMLTNLGIWVYSLFIPDGEWFSEQYALYVGLVDSTFPIFGDVVEIFDDGFSALSSTAHTPPEINASLFGSDPVSVLDFSLIDGTMTTFRDWVSMFLYVYAAFFAMGSIRRFFSPRQLTLGI